MHVFFDLDGTLADPQKGIIACIHYALTALDAPIPSQAKLLQWIGPPLQESFLAVLDCPDRANQAVALYRYRFATVGLFENHMYDGIPEMLTALSASNTLWVTTSKPHIFAHKIIKHFHLDSFFASIYGSELDGTHASKSDLLAHVLNTERLDPAEVVMVGDRRHDIVGAQQNHIPAIGVTWGFGSEQELKGAGAIALCHTPEQLPDLLQSSIIR